MERAGNYYQPDKTNDKKKKEPHFKGLCPLSPLSPYETLETKLNLYCSKLNRTKNTRE